MHTFNTYILANEINHTTSTLYSQLHYFRTDAWTSQRGAVGGAATGAILGGIIGHQSGEGGEGAALGAATGALLGGLLGNAKDQDNARREAEAARNARACSPKGMQKQIEDA